MVNVTRKINEINSPENEFLQECAQKGYNEISGYTEYDAETEEEIKDAARARIKLLWKREEGKTDEEIEEMRGDD
jgi:hypothetical protein